MRTSKWIDISFVYTDGSVPFFAENLCRDLVRITGGKCRRSNASRKLSRVSNRRSVGIFSSVHPSMVAGGPLHMNGNFKPKTSTSLVVSTYRILVNSSRICLIWRILLGLMVVFLKFALIAIWYIRSSCLIALFSSKALLVCLPFATRPWDCCMLCVSPPA